MFWSKNKKNRYTPVYQGYTPFLLYKCGVRGGGGGGGGGYKLHGHVILMYAALVFTRNYAFEVSALFNIKQVAPP